jgi:hypothetical protein
LVFVLLPQVYPCANCHLVFKDCYNTGLQGGGGELPPKETYLKNKLVTFYH